MKKLKLFITFFTIFILSLNIQSVSSNNISKNITVEITDVNPNPGYTNQQISITGGGLDPENCDLLFSWDFNSDGNWEIYQKLVPGGCGGGWLYDYTSYSYSTPGTYYITLIIENNLGDYNKDTIPIQILNDPPEAGFTYFPIYPSTQDEIQFIDTSIPGCGAIQIWEWDFGDGNNADIQNPIHKYSDDGTYVCTLYVVDCQEGTDSVSRYIVVSNSIPTAEIINIHPNPANKQGIISFEGYGIDLDGYIDEYLWTSDIDGVLSNNDNFKTNSLSIGNHVISLTVKDDDGDWSEIVSQNLEISNELNLPPSIPTINGESSGEAGKSYEYNIKSIDPEGDEITYCIDWGDDTPEVCFGPFNSGEEIQANNTWDIEGSYNIRVMAKDIYGAESDWALLEVTMPNYKSLNFELFKIINPYFTMMKYLINIILSN